MFSSLAISLGTLPACSVGTGQNLTWTPLPLTSQTRISHKNVSGEKSVCKGGTFRLLLLPLPPFIRISFGTGIWVTIPWWCTAYWKSGAFNCCCSIYASVGRWQFLKYFSVPLTFEMVLYQYPTAGDTHNMHAQAKEQCFATWIYSLLKCRSSVGNGVHWG